jgi:hypothetical protein
MKTKLLRCLAATAMAAASVVATPAMAQRGGGMHGGFSGGGFRGGMVTGRSVFVPGGNRFVGAPFAGQHAFVSRRFFDEGRRDRIEARRDRFEDRFHHRRFGNRFDNFGFFGLPFAYDYAAYGNGCWRWDGWQWINICYGYNYGY